MKNNNRKTLVSSIVLIALLIATFYLVKEVNKPKVVVGNKGIEITIVDRESKTVYEEEFRTDAGLLGEVLDELNTDADFAQLGQIVLEGDKDSEFGRFISEITFAPIEEGEFWVYESENNKVCLAEAFCPGVDQLAIEDKDEFTFIVLKP